MLRGEGGARLDGAGGLLKQLRNQVKPGETRTIRGLARILHELPELSVDFTSAAWLIACRVIAQLWLKGDQPGCAVKSGDKPAAVHFVFLTKPDLPLCVIEILE
jgi:hypothetical protein